MKAAALSSTETSGVQDGGDTSGTAGTESQAESGVNAKAGTETGADQISDMAQSGRAGSTDQRRRSAITATIRSSSPESFPGNSCRTM